MFQRDLYESFPFLLKLSKVKLLDKLQLVGLLYIEIVRNGRIFVSKENEAKSSHDEKTSFDITANRKL